MKFNHIFIVFFLFFSQSVFSQFSLDGGLGLNYSKLKITDSEYRLGQYLFFAPNFQLSDSWNVGIEFQGSIEGTNISLNPDGVVHKFVRAVPFVEFQFFKKINFLAGVNFGRIVSDYKKIHIDDWIKPAHTYSTLGFVAGIKYQHKKIAILARFNENRFMTKLSNKPGGRNFQVGIGYTFF